MDVLTGAYEYVLNNGDRFWEAVRVHLSLSLLALLIATAICALARKLRDGEIV